MSKSKRKDQSDAARRGQNHARAADEILTEIDSRTNQAAQLVENAWGVLADGFRQNQSPFLPLGIS